MLPIPVLSIHDLSTVRSGYGPLMKVSARSAGGQVCILHLARFNDFPGTKIVAIEPVQKTKPREKMVYFSLTAKLEWLTLVRPAATARAHSRSRNAFGEETLTSCLTRVGGPEISRGRLHEANSEVNSALRLGSTSTGFFVGGQMGACKSSVRSAKPNAQSRLQRVRREPRPCK